MLFATTACLGFSLQAGQPALQRTRAAKGVAMLYGPPREVQIIPSVLPADWANMGAPPRRTHSAPPRRAPYI